MGKRVSNDRFERRLSSFALLVSRWRARSFSRPLKRLFLPRRYSTGSQRRSDSDRALSFESTAHTLQDSVRASNYAILGMPCITRFSLFAALTKVPTSYRLLETARHAGPELAPLVIRGNATPPNMNRSLINVQAINRRIIVLGFATRWLSGGVGFLETGTVRRPEEIITYVFVLCYVEIVRTREREWSFLTSPRNILPFQRFNYSFDYAPFLLYRNLLGPFKY